LDLTDKKLLQDYRREFLNHVKNRFHGDFDRGFFSAWADCMRVLERMDIAVQMDNSRKGKPEALGVDENQATIENFLDGEQS
jgi:hypothetical protein